VLNAFIELFKPAPHLPEISDPKIVNKEYPYWRRRTLYAIFIGYAMYYFTRKSFVFAMPGLINELQYDKAQLGMLGTLFSITYALSKFSSGLLSDLSNPRYFMAFGLILSGVTNILFGFSSSLTLFAVCWGLNGWFQGFGAPPCIRFLTQWYSHSERGGWWSTWSISHNIGAFAISWIAGWCLYYFNWRYAMCVPGLLCIGGGFFLINRLRDTPQSLGLPAIEKWRNDYTDSDQSTSADQEDLTAFQLLRQYILNNPYLWLLAIAYFFIYIIRMAANDWTALYLIESKGYTTLGASATVSILDVGGLFGTLFAGWSSDQLFSARRGPINILFTAAIIVSILLLWYVPEGFTSLDSAAIFLIGFAVYGPQMLIGVSAAELTHKRAVATSNGFISFAAYFGAAAAGYPFGKVLQELGWDSFFYMLLSCGVLALLILMPLWGVNKYKPAILQESTS
jgi:OPA family sugar phosphate sensor protein UhpC-like MFS transporter